MSWLESWRERELRAIELRAQSEREHVEAEFALAMHKAESFGAKGAPAMPQPTQQTQSYQNAPQQQQGNDNGDHVYCQCGTEILDSPNFPKAKKIASSMQKYGRVVCYKCEKNMKAQG